MTTLTLIMRWLILCGGSVAVYRWVVWGRERHMVGYAMMPIVFLCNIMLFTLFRVLNISMDVISINSWSLAIHLHAIAVLLTAPMLYVRPPRTETNHGG